MRGRCCMRERLGCNRREAKDRRKQPARVSAHLTAACGGDYTFPRSMPLYCSPGRHVSMGMSSLGVAGRARCHRGFKTVLLSAYSCFMCMQAGGAPLTSATFTEQISVIPDSGPRPDKIAGPDVFAPERVDFDYTSCGVTFL